MTLRSVYTSKTTGQSTGTQYDRRLPHTKMALDRSINRSQHHNYGLLDFTLFDQHKPLMFLGILPLLT